MDAQELRTLQEAYLEVYDNELSEGYKKFPYKKVEGKIHKKEADNPTGRGTPQSVKMSKVYRHFKGGKEVTRTEKREHSPQISKSKEKENRERGTQKEQVDIYDIILSHLLDEGYAETQEAAQVMMVNMSEEWRESIIKNQLNEISQKLATKAFARRATGEFEDDNDPSNYTKSGEYKSDLTKRRIEKKFGKKAGAHAERAAHASIFGRKGLGGMPSVS